MSVLWSASVERFSVSRMRDFWTLCPKIYGYTELIRDNETTLSLKARFPPILVCLVKYWFHCLALSCLSGLQKEGLSGVSQEGLALFWCVDGLSCRFWWFRRNKLLYNLFCATDKEGDQKYAKVFSDKMIYNRLVCFWGASSVSQRAQSLNQCVPVYPKVIPDLLSVT